MQILQEPKMQTDQKENCEVIKLRCGKVLYIRTCALKNKYHFPVYEKK